MRHYRYTMRFLLALVVLSLPAVALGQEDVVFTPLTALPGVETVGGAENIADFLNVLYRLCVGVAATLAVIQIMRGGVMWMRSDSVTGHKDARQLIVSSVFGLLLVLSPVILFGLIDPRILNLSLDASQLKLNSLPAIDGSSYGGGPADGDTLNSQEEIDACNAEESCQAEAVEGPNGTTSYTMCRCVSEEVNDERPDDIAEDTTLYGSNQQYSFAPEFWTYVAISYRPTDVENQVCTMAWGGSYPVALNCAEKKQAVEAAHSDDLGFKIVQDCTHVTQAVSIRGMCFDPPRGDIGI